MSFRARLVLASALAVAAAVVAASALTYVFVRGELRGEVDAALEARAATTRLRIVQDPGSGRRFLDLPPPLLGGAAGYTQLVTPSGTTIRPFGEEVVLPVTARDRAAAEGKGDTFFSDAQVAGHARSRSHSAARAGVRAPDRETSRRGRQRAGADPQLAAPDRGPGDRHRCGAGPGRRARRARTGAAPHPHRRGGDRDTRPLPPDRRARARRALAPRLELQHHARSARRLLARAAAARLRRIA